MAYANIQNFYASESQPGGYVILTLAIRNDYSSPISVLGEITYSYGGQIFPVNYQGDQSGTIDSGGMYLVYGNFEMPNAEVTITARTYYYGGDGQWHLDQTSQIIRGTGTGTGQTGGWVQATERIINLSFITAVSGQWVQAAEKIINVAYQSASGAWVLATEKLVNVQYQAGGGGWVQATEKIITLTFPKPSQDDETGGGGSSTLGWAILAIGAAAVIVMAVPKSRQAVTTKAKEVYSKVKSAVKSR